MLNFISKQNVSTPWFFFILALGLSWLCWIPAGLLRLNEPALLPTLLHYLGGLVPFVVTLLLLFTASAPQARKDYWRRIIEIRRIGLGWLVVIFLIVPLITFLAVGADRVLGGQGAQPEAWARYASSPLSVLPFAFFMLFFGPVPEEMAWRGYGLDPMQHKYGALKAGFFIGVLWTIWHLPLFFIPGSYQHGLGVGSLSFWLFMLDKVPQSICMIWIYNNTDRSTLSAILLHFMVNFIGELFALSGRAEVFTIVLWAAAALLVALLWDAQTLTRLRKPAG